MESDARAFINNHDILICSVWFLFYLIKPPQTRHIVVGEWFILSSVYWIILVCVLSDRSIEGKPQRTFLLNSLDNYNNTSFLHTGRCHTGFSKQGGSRRCAPATPALWAAYFFAKKKRKKKRQTSIANQSMMFAKLA